MDSDISLFSLIYNITKVDFLRHIILYLVIMFPKHTYTYCYCVVRSFRMSFKCSIGFLRLFFNLYMANFVDGFVLPKWKPWLVFFFFFNLNNCIIILNLLDDQLTTVNLKVKYKESGENCKILLNRYVGVLNWWSDI